MTRFILNGRVATPLAVWTVAGILMVTSVGCTGLGQKSPKDWKMPWSKKDKPPEPYPNPVKMAATWTPDTLVQTGRTPTRGFGGRLFFYDEKTRAVPVEGDLTVHAFAENTDGSVGEVKRYHFTSEQFTQHFSQSDLGASYSIWIPWDAVGGDQMRISLVPSFKAASGRLVQGETALVGLPGRRKAVESIAKKPDTAQMMVASRDPSKSGLTTTTIPVRRGLDRLATPRSGTALAADAIVAARPYQGASGFNASGFDASGFDAATGGHAGQKFDPSYPMYPDLTKNVPPYDPSLQSTPMPTAAVSGATTGATTEAAFPGHRPQRLGHQVVPASAEEPIR
jgi:hypothetical protein